MPFWSWIFFWRGPKWQFGLRYFYKFSTYFFLKYVKTAGTEMMIFVKKKKCNHVGFIKIFFLIMFYKKKFDFMLIYYLQGCMRYLRYIIFRCMEKCSYFKKFKPVASAIITDGNLNSQRVPYQTKKIQQEDEKARMRIRCIIWPKTNRTVKYGSSPIMRFFFWEVKTNSSKKIIFIQKIDETEVIVYMVPPK